MAKLTIDGQEIEAPQGENLLLTARRLKIEVPHFCYHEKLSVAANCRMCLVEVEKQPKLVPACQMAVAEGMVVRTNTPKVLDARKAIMEFLLVNHPLDCPICDKAGECRLQDYYMEHDGQNSRQKDYKVAKPRLEVLGPHVNYNAERCIMCTRCVRFMTEVAQETQLGVFGRGDRNVIGVFPDKPLNNDYSLNVVDLCPVGALGNLDFRFNSRVWTLQKTNTICAGCSRGCNIEVHHKNGVIYRAIPRQNDAVNQTWMCDEGRLSYHASNEQRASSAMLKGKVAALDEVLQIASLAIEKAAQDQGAGWALAISASLTNEEVFVWLQLVKHSLPKAKIYLCSPKEGLNDHLLRRADQSANRKGFTLIAQALGLSFETYQTPLTPSALSNVRNLIVLGALSAIDDAALLKNLDFTLFMTAHDLPVSHEATVVLPIRTHFELNGSFVNEFGRIQRLRPCHTPIQMAQSCFEWANRVCARLPGFNPWMSSELIFENIAQIVGDFSHLSLVKLGLMGKELGSGVAASTQNTSQGVAHV